MAWPYAWGSTFVDDSGAGTDGEVISKSDITDLTTELNANQQSPTYPTITPAATTTAVQDAKGAAYASLKARLDAIADPATGAPSSTAFATYVLGQSMSRSLGGQNLCPNDDLLMWPLGDTTAPAHTTLFGGGTIVRTGNGLGDTTTKVGPFSAKVTYSTNPTLLYWTIISTTAAASMVYLKGTIKFGLGCWVNTSVGNAVRLRYDDGVTVAYSSYHPGNGQWQFLTFPANTTFSSLGQTWNAAATQLICGPQIESAGSFYCGGMTCIVGDFIPSNHLPTPTRRMALLDYYLKGNVAVADRLKIQWPPNVNCFIKNTQLGVITAPLTTAIIADIDRVDMLSGATLGSPYSTRPTIAASAIVGVSAIPDGTYANRCLLAGRHALAFNIDQIGTGTVGADLHAGVTAITYQMPSWLERYGTFADGI